MKIINVIFWNIYLLINIPKKEMISGETSEIIRKKWTFKMRVVYI